MPIVSLHFVHRISTLQNMKQVRPEEKFFLQYFREKLSRDSEKSAEEQQTKLSREDDHIGDIYEDEDAFAHEIAEKFMEHHARTTSGGFNPDDDPDFFDDDDDDFSADEKKNGMDFNDNDEKDETPDISMLMGVDGDDDSESNDEYSADEGGEGDAKKKAKSVCIQWLSIIMFCFCYSPAC